MKKPVWIGIVIQFGYFFSWVSIVECEEYYRHSVIRARINWEIRNRDIENLRLPYTFNLKFRINPIADWLSQLIAIKLFCSPQLCSRAIVGTKDFSETRVIVIYETHYCAALIFSPSIYSVGDRLVSIRHSVN